MMFPTKRAGVLTALAVTAAAIVVPATTTTADPASDPATQSAPTPTTTAACPTGFWRVKDYKRYASRVYRRGHVREAAHNRMARMLRCQASAWGKRWAERYHQRFLSERAARAAERVAAILARSLTPYVCSHGRWAIPCSIVSCESGGSWNAANPSGAIGPYQLLGKNAPWPVRSAADRLKHHRIASNLWRGGAGASHWTQCLG